MAARETQKLLLLPRAQARTMTLLALSIKNYLGSHGVRGTAKGPNKFGGIGGKVDHVARKSDSPTLEATQLLLSCLAETNAGST